MNISKRKKEIRILRNTVPYLNIEYKDLLINLLDMEYKRLMTLEYYLRNYTLEEE